MKVAESLATWIAKNVFVQELESKLSALLHEQLNF